MLNLNLFKKSAFIGLFALIMLVSQNLFSQCYNGTVNRHAGTWHSNLYIGASKTSNTNYLVAWGENSQLLTTGSGTVYCIPTIVPATNYSGVPIEVRGASSTGSSNKNIFVLRTEDLNTPANNKIYLYGDGTLPASGFGGARLNTASSEFSAKLPSGITMSEIAFVKVSPVSLAIVTKTDGNVYITSTTSTDVLFGDNLGAASNGNNWHKVLTASGTALSGVTKLSLSAGGALALSGANLYFFGKNGYIPTSNSTIAKANTTYAKLLNDPNISVSYFPTLVSGETINDVVCLGSGSGTAATNLYFLTSKGRVYVNGNNVKGELGNGSATSATQSTFVTVTFPAEVNNTTNPIVKIDGSNESSTNVSAIGAMDQNGNLYTWGSNDGNMIGGAATYYATPRKINFEPNSTLTANTATVIPINDFTIGGHFSCAFDNTNDAYWYLGHFKTASMGALGNDPLNNNAAYCTEDINQEYFFRVNNTSIDFGFNCSNAIPTITVSSANLLGFSTCLGLASSEKSFTISGVNLTSDISVSAPTGYEISLTSGGSFTSNSPLTLTPTSGTVSTTSIYVRLKSDASNGASGNIDISATNATTQNVATGTGVVNTLPSSPTGTDGSSSGAGTVGISGSVNTGETIDWYASSTGGSPLSGGTGTTSFTTPSISSTTIYYAQARNTTTGCISASRTAVTATISSNATPTIATSGTLTAFSTCVGFASAVQNFTVSGTDLTSDITVAAPTGFELSLTSGGSYSNSVTITHATSTISATPVYVRLKSDANTGASGNISCTATNATSVDVSTGSATVNQIPSSPTGVDGSRTGSGTVAISGSVSTGETIDWYAGATGGSPLTGGTGTTNFTTPSISSTTLYYAETRNTSTSCISASRTAVTATIQAPNNNGDVTPPAITHPLSQNNDGTSSIKISENTAAVTTYTADETVTWSITSGSEQNLFSIDSNTGALTFNSPLPLFASPTDSAPTNSYIVQITATDTNGNVSRQTLTVTISPFCGSWGN